MPMDVYEFSERICCDPPGSFAILLKYTVGAG